MVNILVASVGMVRCFTACFLLHTCIPGRSHMLPYVCKALEQMFRDMAVLAFVV